MERRFQEDPTIQRWLEGDIVPRINHDPIPTREFRTIHGRSRVTRAVPVQGASRYFRYRRVWDAREIRGTIAVRLRPRSEGGSTATNRDKRRGSTYKWPVNIHVEAASAGVMQMRGGVAVCNARITAVLASTEAARSSFPYLRSAVTTRASLSLPWIFPVVKYTVRVCVCTR